MMEEGVHVGEGWKRVLYADDDKADDRLELLAEAKAIRSELSALRRRLREVGRRETFFDFDSRALDAAGTLSSAIVHLYSLVEGDHSLAVSADRLRHLWTDVAAHPDQYIIEPGTSKAAHERDRAKRVLADSAALGEGEPS